MTTKETPIVEAEASAETPAETPAPDKDSGKGLRKQLEASLAENRELKAEKRDSILAGIGLSHETGLGKALAEKFDAGDVELDNLASVAVSDYGHVVPDAQHAQAAEIQLGQAQLDQVGNVAGSVAPPSEKDALAKAEAEGDYQTTMNIKGNQVAEMFRQGR